VRAWLEHDFFLIEVTDSGCGIAEENVKHVFERSWSSRRGQSRGGNGLGPAIVRAAVEAGGGTVSIRSSVGAGTTFTLCIPRRFRDRRPGGASAPALPDNVKMSGSPERE
jgi:two-component system sensor histidine kinase BaeS